jgi:hypothetical protein
MNSLDLSNALLYGIPIALSAGLYGGFDCLLARRNQPAESAPQAAPKRRNLCSISADSGVRLVVATSAEQVDAAAELVRKRYAWRGYEFPDADAAAEQSRRRSSQEITFLAAFGRIPVGTLTLGLDGPAGLLAEASYGEVIAEYRTEGHRVCELTRLALAQRIDSKTILAALFCLAHAVGRTRSDVTHVFIEVNPRHVAFYCRILGFVVAAGEKFCERVRARSVLLELEIDALEERLLALGVATRMRPLMAEAA